MRIEAVPAASWTQGCDLKNLRSWQPGPNDDKCSRYRPKELRDCQIDFLASENKGTDLLS